MKGLIILAQFKDDKMNIIDRDIDKIIARDREKKNKLFGGFMRTRKLTKKDM